MRHYKKSGMKLGTDSSHTKAMKKSLACALLSNDRIKTTEQRAKAIRPDVERVVTWAKKGDLHSRRLAIAKLGNPELVREVFDKAAQGMWADRNGGYTRIMKLGQRKGDSAEVVIIEMVNESLKPKKTAKTEVKPVKKAAAKKPADKKAEKAADEAGVDKKAAEATAEPAEKPAE
jgi:large subunit ribosomal protein L17